MAQHRLERELLALRSGEITFAKFSTRISKDVAGIARSIYRKFDVPPYVDEDDMRQEALIAVWRALDTWEPERGRTLRGHCVFSACDRVRKAIRKARNEDYHHNDTRGRYDLCESGLVRREADDCRQLEERLGSDSVSSTADRIAELYERFSARLAEMDALSQVAAEALVAAGGDRYDAAVKLFVDPRNETIFELDAARAVVRQVARRLAA